MNPETSVSGIDVPGTVSFSVKGNPAPVRLALKYMLKYDVISQSVLLRKLVVSHFNVIH